jgi:hypothetical protein
MRDPTGDREPRRRDYRRRFLLVFGGFLLAMIVIWTLLGSLALMAAKLRVSG